MNKGVLIIGAGPAGVQVAETLRRWGYDAPITMLSREPFPPYSPPLLADYLETRGSSELIFWKGKGFCQDYGVQCELSAEVVGVEPQHNRATLRDGRQLEYDHLVIASGSNLWIPIECECPTERPEQAYYNFKSLTAVNQLLEHVRKGAHKVVIVGAGFIGMEIAVTLCRIGLAVLVVEMMDRILPRMVTKDIAKPLEAILRDFGIELLLNHKGQLLRGREMAEELVLENGKTLKADLFVAATGVRPNVSFLEGSGIPVARGVLVDQHLRAGMPNVFACGDVAAVPDLITGNRYPHAIYPEALKQGEVVALNILGESAVYNGGLNMNSLYHFGLPFIGEGAMVTETRPDEELTYSRDGIMRKLALKGGRLLRYELVGKKTGSGLLHTLLARRDLVEPIKYQLLTGQYNQARHLLSPTVGSFSTVQS